MRMGKKSHRRKAGFGSLTSSRSSIPSKKQIDAKLHVKEALITKTIEFVPASRPDVDTRDAMLKSEFKDRIIFVGRRQKSKKSSSVVNEEQKAIQAAKEKVCLPEFFWLFSSNFFAFSYYL